MRSLAVLAGLLLVQTLTSFGQGSVTYQSTLGVGKEKYIFAYNPASPLTPIHGGSLADYASATKLEGTGFYAELWWAPGETPNTGSLQPVPGSLVTFRTGATAGLINGKSKLDIPGTFGGDKVTLQLRVWENYNQTVNTWVDAINGAGQRGASNLWTHELAGVGRDGSPKLGTGSIANGLTYFNTPVPEPSSAVLALLGLGALAFGRIRGSSSSRFSH
ncbi:MAG: PEP-CTERM sorting domain-containing protein [Verrucomicrobiales bacterium]|nr:PEP-CTERM sorting domain-containing protein [Verrucomicrobiales bacterium]